MNILWWIPIGLLGVALCGHGCGIAMLLRAAGRALDEADEMRGEIW